MLAGIRLIIQNQKHQRLNCVKDSFDLDDYEQTHEERLRRLE